MKVVKELEKLINDWESLASYSSDDGYTDGLFECINALQDLVDSSKCLCAKPLSKIIGRKKSNICAICGKVREDSKR